MSLLSATLLLLAAAPASDNTLRLYESLPAGFQADGRLDEWTQPPSLTLGTSRRGASPDEASATLWLAVRLEGLVIAGELRAAPTREGSEAHVEVSLTLPPPAMPPLAFVNQFKEQQVPTEKDCPRRPPKAVAACEAWWKQQTERRQQLQDTLVARYSVRPGGVARSGLTEPVGTARTEPFPGGYRFEALIPASAFPRTAEAPLGHLNLRVDVVDDASKPARPSASPSFQTVTLARPLRFGQWPELLEQALKAQPGASYQPGPDADSLQVWVNPARAYQYAPQAPSPDVVRVDLSAVKALATVGDVELVSVPAEVSRRGVVDRWLVSRRGRTLVDTRNIGGDEVRTAPRAPGLHLLQVYFGPSNPMGTGTCGECPSVSFQHFTMDARGRFSQSLRLEGTGGLTERPVSWNATEDLSRLEAFDGGVGQAGRQLAVRHTLDPETGRYRTEKLRRAGAPEAAQGDR